MLDVEHTDPTLWKEINRAYLANDAEAMASGPLQTYRRLLRESGSWFVPGRVTSESAFRAALSPYGELVFDQYNRVKEDLNMQPYAELARLITGMKMTFVGILSADHSNLLTQTGLPPEAVALGKYPRSEVLCEYTASRPKGTITEFKDIAHDIRLLNHPYNTGTGPESMRSYIGVSLTTVLGTNIGTLCCMDTTPRSAGWTAEQQAGIQMIEELIMKDLDLQVDRSLAVDAKKVFVTSVNHELKTPVHGLLASAELLKAYRASETQPQLSSFESECLGTIEHCANTLVDVIDNVLSFAKIEPDADHNAPSKKSSRSSIPTTLSVADHNLTSVDLVEFIEQIIDSCWAGKITSGRDLMVIYDADLSLFSHKLFINRGELSRIILNIFGNACKYTERGYVYVKLTTSSIAIQQQSHMTINLSITDTGRGMLGSFIETGDLFKPFVQADSKAEGVGLGMSIVKTFVEKSNGRLDVESELGRGTSINVQLPLPIDRDHVFRGSVQKIHAALLGKSFHMTEDEETLGTTKLKQSLVETCSREFGMVQSSLEEAHVIISLSVNRVREIFRQGCRAPCLLAASVRDWTQACSEDPLVHLVQLPLGPGKLFSALSKVCEQLDQPEAQQKLHPASIHQANLSNVSEAKLLSGKRARAAETIDDDSDACSTTTIPPIKKRVHKSSADMVSTIKRATRPRVLCVDDNNINLRILQTVVAKQQLPHDTAHDGIEAVQKYATTEPKFDLIFMDVNMPKQNGLVATQEIRAYEKAHGLPPTIIIGLSAGGSAQNKTCLDAGMDGYCDKPVSVQALATMIKTWRPCL